MKKTVVIFMAIILILSTVTSAIGQQSTDSAVMGTQSNDFVVNEAGYLTEYTGTGGDIEIPDGVVRICAGVFSDISALTSVVVPSSVEYIEDAGFNNCINLSKITIPSSLIFAFDSFNGCSNLKELEIYYSNDVSSLIDAIQNWGLKETIETLTIEAGITETGTWTFDSFQSLISVTLPNTLELIGQNSFSRCLALESITIPEGVTTIDGYAFEESTGLISITIPNTVTTIGYNAFLNCSSLVIYGDTGSYAETYAQENSIPFTSLGEVVIPPSDSDFVVVDGELIDYVGAGGNVVIPEHLGITRIGEFTFEYYESITGITIPESVTSIGDFAFLGCTGLTDLNLPDSIANIGTAAFSDCTGLSRVSISGDTETYDLTAFDNCTNIKTLDLRLGTETIIANQIIPFQSYLETLNIAHGFTEIGTGAIYNCPNLIAVNIPNSVTKIGDSAFLWCFELAQIIIPDSVIEIGEQAFAECTSLETIVIPEGVTTIGYSAFSDCTNLTSVSIPGSVTEIGFFAFDGCTKLTEATIINETPGITRDTFEDGQIEILNILNSDKTSILTRCPVAAETINIGEGITTIGSDIYYNSVFMNSFLQNISLPDSLQAIGNSAFEDATNLASIVFPPNLKTIGSRTFDNCDNLLNISIPNSIEAIGSHAFDLAPSQGTRELNITLGVGSTEIPGIFNTFGDVVNTVHIADGITSIGQNAFERYDDINITIAIPETVISIDEYAFSSFGYPTLHVINNSYAHGYAAEHNIPFVTIGGGGSGPIGDVVPVTGLTISQSTHTFNDQSPISLSATVYPNNATNSTVIWSSSDQSVASVWYMGVPASSSIFPEKAGTAVITARTVDGRYQASCTIEVKKIPVNYTPERDILRKIGLAQLSYDPSFIEWNRDQAKGKYVTYYSPKNEQMFKVNNESISWGDFYNEYAAKHIIVDYANEPDGMQAVAFRDENGEIIIAYRGTSDMNLFGGDLGDGFWYTLLNGMAKQYNSALSFYEKVNREHNPDQKKISVTGHSLGGALAAYVGINKGDEIKAADSFNDATGWIIWNTFIDNAKTIKNFSGTDTSNNTSYVNMDEAHEFNIVNAIGTGYRNFNVYTAKTNLYTRNRYEFMSNTHTDNKGGIHGMPALLTYNNGNFTLERNVGINETLVNKITCDNGVYIPGFPSLFLGTSGTDIISSNQGVANYIYPGNGNDIVYGGTERDVIVASGTGRKTIYGKRGNDTYIIDVEEIDSEIFIDDPSGNDFIYIKGTSGINDAATYPITEDDMYYYLSLGNGKGIKVNKIRASYSPKITLQDEANNRRDFLTNQGIASLDFTLLEDQENTLKSLRLTGQVQVEIYDQAANLLGIHDNNTNTVQIKDYGYFYPMLSETESYLDIDLINGDYTLKITSNGSVDLTLYDLDAQGSICYEQKGIDLSDGTILVINSDFLNSGNKFALEKDGIITPLSAQELALVAQVNIAQTAVNVSAGTSKIVSAQVTPSNALKKGVSWSVIQPSEDKVVAMASTNENGVTTVVGISEGAATLRATASGATDIYQEIPITVTQAAAPIISTGSYSPWSYTAEAFVTISGTMPSGFDELYFTENDDVAVKTIAITVTNEGITTVKVMARNSSTGELTKEAVVSVKIDRTDPAILGVENSEEYYLDRLVTVTDLNLEKVTINGAIDYTPEELLRGKWFSEIGDYTLTAKDFSGKETTVAFSINTIPAASEITSDSLELINAIRNEFEAIKNTLPEPRRNTLEAQILELETQWVISTGVWSIVALENNAGIVTIKVLNRLNEYTELPSLLLAVYDDDNKLAFIEERIIEESITDYIFNITEVANGNKLKAFLWQDLNSLIPVTTSLQVPQEVSTATPTYMENVQTIENGDGTFTTLGTDPGSANKQITLIVYQGPELTDGTIQYIDQTTADLDGNYIFPSFIPKAPPTVSTGNFTVSIGGAAIPTPLAAGTIGTFTPVINEDCNQDGITDLYDLVMVGLALGSTPSSPSWDTRADINGDGVINEEDLIILKNAYGSVSLEN